MPPRNPPHEALTRAINNAIARGEPVIVEQPAPEVELFLLKRFNAELLADLKAAVVAWEAQKLDPRQTPHWVDNARTLIARVAGVAQ